MFSSMMGDIIKQCCIQLQGGDIIKQLFILFEVGGHYKAAVVYNLRVGTL